jgi:hypothetical protein
MGDVEELLRAAEEAELYRSQAVAGDDADVVGQVGHEVVRGELNAEAEIDAAGLEARPARPPAVHHRGGQRGPDAVDHLPGDERPDVAP